MLIDAKPLESYEISARDGMIGKVKDFYFDDHTWNVRYVVVDTGTWLSGRKVLISSAALIRPDPDTRTLLVELTQEQVENSPEIDTEKPVSRQHEEELHQHYGWAGYWGPSPAAPTPVPPTVHPAVAPPAGAFRTTGDPTDPTLGETRVDPDKLKGRGRAPEGDPHLRSARAVRNYHIEAVDGSVGHLEDLVVDDDSWSVRYLLINTRNWLPGKKVIVSPDWVREINTAEGSIRVDLTREAIKGSPEFDPDQPISAEYSERLQDHYGRPWR